MLSNVDILKELNKNLFVYPLRLANIKGSSINLSASDHAWSLKTKQSIVNAGQIVIPAHDTALIMTDEVVYVSSKIAGLYHSKVKHVSNGTGHIGTTLDPEWYGKSLIAVHNVSDKDYIINVGDTFVSLTLYYLNSEEKDAPSNNFSGRCDVLDKLGITYDSSVIGVDAENQNDLEDFKKKCRDEQSEEIQKKLDPYNPPVLPFYKKKKFKYIVLIAALIALLLAALIGTQGDANGIVKDYILPIVVVVIGVLVGRLV
jgi:hypothetical protein